MGGDSPALPIARHIQLLATWNFLLFGVTMVLFGTVRANGAVWAPLIILAIGLVPVRLRLRSSATYRWLGADALWMQLPGQLVDQPRAGDRFLSPRRLEEGADGGRAARRRATNAPRKRWPTREPGGALNPAG